MTERHRYPEDMIKCDVCGADGFWDPREPWEVDGKHGVKKPTSTFRCTTCNEAVSHATEHKRYLKKYHSKNDKI